ncbi:MAG TPA: MBL fold metallo-hydrolase [Bryobacterales bacterium]|nr:MBL fold metallo-hydrolase [Bryobacterales bacterium]
MRRLALFAAFALLLGAALRRAPSQTSAVHELAPGVWFRQGDRARNQPANCGWIIFRDYVFVIDANFPWGAREILPEIRKTTSKPIRFLFDTHYHGDHAYGNSLFVDAGAAVVCSQDCAAESRSKGQAGWDKNTATGEFSLKPYRLEHPTVVFGDAMAFDDGEHRVELKRMGPGHTKGDTVAYLPKEKILFTGDLCVNWTSGNNAADPDADHPHWARALGEMARWDVTTVVPGHGSLGTTDTLLRQQAYLQDMWDQVLAGRRAGKSADELVQTIDLSRHGNFAASPQSNASSIRAMYRKAGG